MSTVTIDGVHIYYEVTGTGFPLIFSHEFGGDHRSWENQVRHFSRRYMVITYNARGYPPSDVPDGVDSYSQDIAVSDLHGLLLHLGIKSAYVAGLSMGGTVALNFGFEHPDMSRALIVSGAGTGSTDTESWRTETLALAHRFETEGLKEMGDEYARSRARQSFLRKDPRGWNEFREALLTHDSNGAALTFRGFQALRPSVFEQKDKMRNLKVPTLIICGDEDEPCIEPSIFMRRNIPRSGLAMFPQSGHTPNLEDPALFNRTIDVFLTAVESDKWAERDLSIASGFVSP
ncbi:alpha/beta hydrolase [SAR202 cluster bacterium AD-804-J14_MRT_500m]|nr:alpha/beta hydrolase [SAR202 cluster bacterium AD-804-J14_MRT_500m]